MRYVLALMIGLSLTPVAQADWPIVGRKIDLRPVGINLLVAPRDEMFALTQEEATKACAAKGMRLPTVEELEQIYCHVDLDVVKDGTVPGTVDDGIPSYPVSDPACKTYGTSRTVPGFKQGKDKYYWSSTVVPDFNGIYRWVVNFNIGFRGFDTPDHYHLWARCVATP